LRYAVSRHYLPRCLHIFALIVLLLMMMLAPAPRYAPDFLRFAAFTDFLLFLRRRLRRFHFRRALLSAELFAIRRCRCHAIRAIADFRQTLPPFCRRQMPPFDFHSA
jgi:hypothetical protein